MEEGIEEPEDTAAPEKDAEIVTQTTKSPLPMEEGIEEPEDTAAPGKDTKIVTQTTRSPLQIEEGIEEPEDTATPHQADQPAIIGSPVVVLQKFSPGPAFRTRHGLPQEKGPKRKMTNFEMNKFLELAKKEDVPRDWEKLYHAMNGDFAVSQLKNTWRHYLRKLRTKRFK